MAQHIIDNDDALDAEAEAGAILAGFKSLDELYKKVTMDCVQASRSDGAEKMKPPVAPVDDSKITVTKK